ncbi:polysaccharide lyase 6 family protein [Vibrio rumoiensis]|uniref:Alginate lyase n=1 Tax=Vibrio rumoiensis 1S-45 TaxID=1188252 RepID=A0A1E5DZC5_9VIBR|nr:polysaccharide lyase 6 family protein [Vibrio rumoiensis]OEF23167.1 alginate lyase precursor [Vibrio rumoiensis 1S-45]
MILKKSLLSLSIIFLMAGCNTSDEDSNINTNNETATSSESKDNTQSTDSKESTNSGSTSGGSTPSTGSESDNDTDTSTPIVATEHIVPNLPTAILTVPDVTCTEVFRSTSDLEDAVSKEMEPGTTLCLADGSYSDLEITYGGMGTQDKPIKVAAENPGKAILTGDVQIIMGGQYTQLQGLVFDGATTSSSNLISTRFGTHDLCNHCRITEIAVLNVDTHLGITSGDTSSGEWIHIFGQNNWLDHSIISGKTTASPMISFNRWVDSEWDDETKQAELAKNIIVYKNYIANRAPSEGKMFAGSSDNNYEAIRTGLSETHHFDANSLIVGNLFENIQGEAEVVSNKGTNNVISYNTIRNSYGSLTTRHGNSAKIENNFIFGDGYPFAGGLRIVDGNHSIVNNYISGARYKNTSHHGGIVILGSDGASDGDNGYQQVTNVHIANNTIVDSVNSLNIDGGGKSKQPNTVYLANNLIDKAIGPVITEAARGLPPTSTVVGNIIHGQSFSDDNAVPLGTSGFEFISAGLTMSHDGLYRPSLNTPNLDVVSNYEKGSFSAVIKDMDGEDRLELTMAGADEHLESTDTRSLKPLQYQDVGPIHYQLEKPVGIIQTEALTNVGFDDQLTGWTYSDASIVTDDLSFSRSASLEIGGSGYASQAITLTPNTRYSVSAFVKGPAQFAVNGVGSQGFNNTSNEYSWVNWEFHSGSVEHSELTLSLSENIDRNTEIGDHQLTAFRSNSGTSEVWIKHADNDNGKGDVGSSGDTAFDSSGSARIRFRSATDDFSATPGLSQVVDNLQANTDYVFSLYYYDNKKDSSLSELDFGVKVVNGNALMGETIAEKTVHVRDLDDAPQGSVKTGFRKVEVAFNSGANTSVEIYALMRITDSSAIDLDSDIGSQTEVRVDEFALTYQGAPASDTKAYFDDILMIKRIEK